MDRRDFSLTPSGFAREALSHKGEGNAAQLSAKGIGVTLGGNEILRGVSCDVIAGQLLGIVGPNGSGKTTLIRALAGVLDVTVGEVSLAGQALSRVRAGDRARQIAYMPQSSGRHPFTVLETVLMGRYPHLGRFAQERPVDHAAARAAMERTGTLEFADRSMETLSGGERQRVMLARTLAQESPILLLDEPTSSLDLKHQLGTMESVVDEVSSRRAAAAVIMHDLSLAGRFCDRLLLMRDGEVAAYGEPWEVLDADLLRDAFEVETIVEADPLTGRPQVNLLAPVSREGTALVGAGMTVHLICGAGSGRDLMHQLTTAGFTVTACVLGDGDSDRETADRLGVGYVAAPPFSPVSDEQRSEHEQLMAAADFAVVCDVMVGPNNLPNLQAASAAQRVVMFDGRPHEELDFTGGEATELRSALAKRATLATRGSLLRVLSEMVEQVAPSR